jgi:geranylgeranyl diphosphate synthase type I
MRILANLALFRLSNQGVGMEKLLEAQRMLDSCTLQLIEGQYLDISFEDRLDVRVVDYLDMVQGKTSALIACSLKLGAMLGSEQDTVVQSFYRFGVNLGLAFQITDDILGIWGAPEMTGKSNGSDIRRKKKSYPVVFALESLNGNGQRELERIYQMEEVDEHASQTVMELLESAGARQQATKAASDYLERARQELEAVDLTIWGRESLAAVMDFLAERAY